MDHEKEKSPVASGSSTPLGMLSSPKRLRLDDSGNNECEEVASCEMSIDSNSAMSNSEKASAIENHERPMEFEEIMAFMEKHREHLKSSNNLMDFPSKTETLVNANCPFVIEPYGWTKITISEKLKKMMEDSYTDYEKTGNGMFNALGNTTSNDQTIQRSFTYTTEQIETYLEMKVILKMDNFHVAVLTGESGTGKTVFLKQFYDDPDIDIMYIAAQHSLRKEACRMLNLNFDSNTMTLASLTMRIFDFDYEQYLKYSRRLSTIPIQKIEEIGLPDMFRLNPSPLNSLFTGTVTKKLILCIDKFNMIRTSELYMIKWCLQRLVSAAETPVNVILLLCGDPLKIQPIFVPSSTVAEESLSNGNLTAGGSDTQRRVSGNASSTIELKQTRFEFKQKIRSGNPEYQRFLDDLKSSTTFGEDVFKLFDGVSKVRTIPYEYCIPALLDMPTPNRSDPIDKPGASYLCDVAGWVQRYGKDFNSVVYYSYLNQEAHTMNLSIAFSAWQQCQLFNEAALRRGDKGIPVYQTPRLVPIYSIDMLGQLAEKSRDTLKMPVLPLIIGCRYKVLKSEFILKNGDIVTLVHVEYADEEPYKKIRHLLVVTRDDDLVMIRPGRFSMPLFLDDGLSMAEPRYTPNIDHEVLYGFPLQLAFANTIRGSLGPQIEANVYANFTFMSAEEVYTLLAKLDPGQVKGLAWIK